VVAFIVYVCVYSDSLRHDVFWAASTVAVLVVVVGGSVVLVVGGVVVVVAAVFPWRYSVAATAVAAAMAMIMSMAAAVRFLKRFHLRVFRWVDARGA